MARATRNVLTITAVLVIALLIVEFGTTVRPTGTPSATVESSDRLLEEAFRDQRSGIVVESEGVVDRVLSDDREGSRHQRFIVRLASGQTILMSHNIDLAPRIDGLSVGDTVSFRGQYEWNEQGGVVHWTHHDPDGDRPGGWIRYADRLYR